jgi:pantoate--beta-alanine ligase
MQKISEQLKLNGKKIGFVPTMGFLHEGHISLIKKSCEQCNVTVVSIFVNPTQFAPTEDLESYPSNIEKDKIILEQNKVDYLFLPVVTEIYPTNFNTYVEVLGLTDKFEGEFRPKHFKGVATIVAILFNIVRPHKTFFGQKDAQQTSVVKKMIEDLSYDIELIVCPIVREPDGLAMSSRNIFLTGDDRKKALLLFQSLNEAKKLINGGERNTLSIIKKMNSSFIPEKSIQLNYIGIVEVDSFSTVEFLEAGKSYFILIAAKVGKTRLIDNLLLSISL